MMKLTRSVALAATCVSAALLSSTHAARAQAPACPCSLWPPAATPTNAALTDNQPIEVGVKFRSDVAGFVTALRFYKGVPNGGMHAGHLWSGTGTMLAEAVFVNEAPDGWQEVELSPAVAINANTTYVASYHSDGFFALDGAYFATNGVDASPLHALAAGVDGPNGVFVYGPSAFPAGGATNNYWVDVVFRTDLAPDTTPPAIAAVAPASGAVDVPLASAVRATFNEAIDSATVNASTFELRDAANALLPAAVIYNAATRTATAALASGLLAQTTYTATLKGGVSGLVDLAGNALASDVTWSFTTGTPAPPPDEGPGGPILVVASTSNPFGRYYAEILRAEGLNAFSVTDLSLATPARLAAAQVVILGEMPLSSADAAMFADYVANGGNLIAMRPDAQLASVLGLTPQGATLSNAYLQIDTAAAPGAGIVADSIQFHGTADRYVPNGASIIARLSSDPTTPTAAPAVTLATVGALGGQAAAFTFDLARSIVYMRQGNPAWAGQERDANAPIRSDDLFFGAAAGDPRPDWVDLNKVAIPQADEQQRLLANLIQHMNRVRSPLPRFWYLPRGGNAAIVMTGDDHGNGGTVGRFNQFKALSPAGCSVADWQCIRSTSYIYNGTPGMDDAAALGFANDGFEVALHVSTNCANWTPPSLAAFYTQQIAQFRAERPSVPRLETSRTHCIAWSDYATQPKVELANGIRFDTNYYFYPGTWVQNRPGLFTGSAMPMRFADLDGSPIDVYQAATQMTDESEQTYPFTADTLLDRALGPLGFYGVFTANHHTDLPTEQPSDATVASALARGVPVVSARQMLDWIDGRNASSFGSIAFGGGVLTFSIAPDAGARGLTAMVPTASGGRGLVTLTHDGSPVAATVRVVKGVEYAFFDAQAGTYAAVYAADTTPPVVSNITATAGLGNTAAIAWTTDEPSDSRVDYGVSASALTSRAAGEAFTTVHRLDLSGLAPITTYFYRVTSTDAAGHAASSEVHGFSTPATQAAATDTTVADFGAGTHTDSVAIAQAGDGELILTPAAGSEFAGSALPADWTATPYAAGGGAMVTGGALVADGARSGTAATFAAGRALEFVATFSGAPFQDVGFGDTLDSPPWAIVSTAAGGALFARTTNGSATIDTPLPPALLGSPHRYSINWTASSVVYTVDGAVVATHAIAIASPLRPIVADVSVGGGAVAVDWVRLTPYLPAGTFMSRVFDAGQTVNWGALSWTAAAPAGTTAAFFARHGDTPSPDASWTAFTAIAGGGAIGGASRYAQYRVDLSTTDPDATPSVTDVSIGYSMIPANRAPVATDQTVTAAEDAATAIVLSATDAEGSPLAFTIVGAPAHGTLSGTAPAVTYTPAANYSGSDSFTFTANDGELDSNVATVSVVVSAVNDAPVAANDSYTAAQDHTLTVAAPGTLANDADADGDTLHAVLAAGASHGVVSLAADGSFTYAPDAGYFGGDSFTYTSNDGRLASNVATVTLSIAPVAHVPVAAADAYQTNEDTAVAIAAPGVLANDADPDGRALTAVLVRGPLHGELTKFASNGSFRYKPAADYNGADTFVYRAVAGGAQSADATVTLTIAAVDDAPVAADDIYLNDQLHTVNVAAPGVLANDADVDGDALTAVLVTRPVHGKLTFRADGSFTYTSNTTFDGSDSFTYKASDGVKKSAVATVIITGHTDSPGFVAQPDAYTTTGATTLTVPARGVLVNDLDPDGESLTAVLVTPPSHGALAFNADGSFVYTPGAGFTGSDSFVYKAMDEVGAFTPPTLVTIVVE